MVKSSDRDLWKGSRGVTFELVEQMDWNAKLIIQTREGIRIQKLLDFKELKSTLRKLPEIEEFRILKD